MGKYLLIGMFNIYSCGGGPAWSRNFRSANRLRPSKPVARVQIAPAAPHDQRLASGAPSKRFNNLRPLLAWENMSRDMIKIGGVGAIICMLTAIEEAVAAIMLWVSPVDYFFAGRHMSLASGIAWAVGIALLSIGAFGMWKQYKSSFMQKVGIMGIVTVVLVLIASVILWREGGAITSISSMFSFGVALLDLIGIAGIVWLELMGVFFILLGLGLCQLKAKTGVSGATVGAGALTLIAGATACAIIPFGYLVTQGLILIGAILMAYVLFKAK